MKIVKRKRVSEDEQVVKFPRVEEVTYNCSICLESNIPDEKKCYLDTCFHQFCVPCIRKWAQTSCPMCRTPFSKAYFNIRSEWLFDVLNGGSEDAHICIMCAVKSFTHYSYILEHFVSGKWKNVLLKLERGEPIEDRMGEGFFAILSSLVLYAFAIHLKNIFGNKINLKTLTEIGSSIFEEFRLKLEALIRKHSKLEGRKVNFALNLLINHLNIMAPWNCEFFEVLQLTFGFQSYHVLYQISELFRKGIEAHLPDRQLESKILSMEIKRFESYERKVVEELVSKDPELRCLEARGNFKSYEDYMEKFIGKRPVGNRAFLS